MRLYQKPPLSSVLNPAHILMSLYGNRRLLWQFTVRGIEMQHKGTMLGVVWMVLSPLLMFGIYAFVFVVIFDSRFGSSASESRADYAIGLFLGLALVQVVQEVMTVSPGLVVQNPNYVKKIIFPLEILPAATVGVATVRCLVSLSLAILAAWIWGPGIAATALWLVPLTATVIFLALGVAWLLAALGVFLRDVAPIVQFLSIMLMFSSAVFYSAEAIPEKYAFLRYNPMLVIVESSRSALLWHRPPPVTDILYLGLTATFCCLAGYAVMNLLKPAFSDVL